MESEATPGRWDAPISGLCNSSPVEEDVLFEKNRQDPLFFVLAAWGYLGLLE